MIFLGIFAASLATISALERPIDPRLGKVIGQGEWNMNRPINPTKKPETVIENKNVNVVVNVDPKDVAKELWSLIQERLNNRDGRRSLTNHHTIEELEKIVTPMISLTRRSHRPTPFEVAYALDHVTRKALTSDHLKRPSIDDEIDTREIVARMMIELKIITEENEKRVNNELSNTRRMLNYDNDLGNSDDSEADADKYINVMVRIRKSEILRQNVIDPYDES